MTVSFDLTFYDVNYYTAVLYTIFLSGNIYTRSNSNSLKWHNIIDSYYFK